MTVYWLMFSYFALGTLFNHRPRPVASRTSSGELSVTRAQGQPLLAIGIAAVALMIGLRYEVGADWQTYEFMFDWARYRELSYALSIGDPGYQFLNWLVSNMGGQIWVVNTICGLIFGWGLFNFARVQPDPWTAVTVAVPYLIVVVAMGYSRQAVAIGILMAGLAAFIQGATIMRFAAYVCVAALFHKTAVVVLPLVILAGRRNRLLNLLLGGATFVLLYDLFLSDSMEDFVENYIEAEYSSQGAAIRVAMNLLSACVFFYFRRKLKLGEREYYVWRNFSLVSFAMLFLLAILPSSTAVDRISLYLIPLQIAVFSYLPARALTPSSGRTVIILYAFGVMFVWLNYAAHSKYWVPYNLHPM